MHVRHRWRGKGITLPHHVKRHASTSSAAHTGARRHTATGAHTAAGISTFNAAAGTHGYRGGFAATLRRLRYRHTMALSVAPHLLVTICISAVFAALNGSSTIARSPCSVELN